jgi:hypothetical protein
VDASTLAREIERVVQTIIGAFGSRSTSGFALVEVDFGDIVAGTSEHGAIFTEQGKLASAFDLSYWAHEISHQWWGVNIGTNLKTPVRTLFSERLVEYGALIAIRTLRGDKAAYEYAAWLRAKFAALPLEARRRPPAMFKPSNQAETIEARRLATIRGALALDCAAGFIGRQAFNHALARFTSRYANGLTSWAALDEYLIRTQPQLAPVFDVWLHKEDGSLPHCREGRPPGP